MKARFWFGVLRGCRRHENQWIRKVQYKRHKFWSYRSKKQWYYEINTPGIA